MTGDSGCLSKYVQNSKITLLNFETNNGPAFSKWKFIEYIQKNMDNYNKNDICLILDGDDYLLENALEIINQTYILNKCWLLLVIVQDVLHLKIGNIIIKLQIIVKLEIVIGLPTIQEL